MDAINSKCSCAIQLCHDEEETTWENHGWIRLKGADDVIIYESENYQHNKLYSQQQAEALKIAGIAESYFTSTILTTKKRGESDDTADETVDSEDTGE